MKLVLTRSAKITYFRFVKPRVIAVSSLLTRLPFTNAVALETESGITVSEPRRLAILQSKWVNSGHDSFLPNANGFGL